jgi:hypothetical protein
MLPASAFQQQQQVHPASNACCCSPHILIDDRGPKTGHFSNYSAETALAIQRLEMLHDRAMVTIFA